jgi:hypothetical protein
LIGQLRSLWPATLTCATQNLSYSCHLDAAIGEAADQRQLFPFCAV